MKLDLTTSQITTAIGSCLLHIVAGVATIWGSTNIYYLSYFHQEDPSINGDTNSIILISIIIPLSIFLVLSTRLCDKIGFGKTIKLCSIVFFISQFFVFLKLTLALFTIFSLIIPVSCISVSLIPTINLFWSHFLQQKSICTAVTLVFLGLGTIIWNVAFIQIVNPNNLEAQIDQNGSAYFSKSVTENLLGATKIIMLICSVIYLIGAFLMKEPIPSINIPRKKETQNIIEVKEQKQSKQQQELNQQNKEKDKQKPTSERYVLMTKGSQGVIEVQNQIKSQENPQNAEPGSDHIILKQTEKQKVTSALKDPKCLIIFLLLIVIDIYPVYLLNNFKVIYMPIFNDDRFLAICVIINTVANIVGTFLWGFFAHKIGNVTTVGIVVSATLVGGFLGFFSQNKVVVVIFMFIFGIGDRGLQTVAGPALVQIYGLRTATLLLPYKGLSFILGFILAPIFQIATSNFFTPFEELGFLFIFCIVSFIIGIYYSNKYRQFDLKNRQTIEKSYRQQKQQMVEYQKFQEMKSKITQT